MSPPNEVLGPRQDYNFWADTKNIWLIGSSIPM